ncbi:Sex-determining fem-1 [Fusarium sp. NRRL 25303]|nr:Sex-determining fem-1 [Fusarium sp. NRRL 25303]
MNSPFSGPRSPSPINPRLVVCSPLPIKQDTVWPLSIPWLMLRDLLSDIQALRQSRTNRPYFSFQELAVSIGASMPEWYLGESTHTASILLGNQANEILPEYIKFMMYALSNGTRFLDRAEWDIFSSILRENMADLKPKLQKLQSHSITVRAFLEKVFQMEIYWATQIDDPANRHKDYLPEWSLDIIKMLLESGVDPNYCVAGRESGLTTPIGRALNIGHIDLAELLLSFNVRIDDTQASFDGQNAIPTISRGRLSSAIQLRLLNLLKKYKAVSLEEILCGALRLDDMELIEGILQENIDVTKVQKAPSKVLTGEIFIAAAIRGDCQIISQLQELSPSGLTCKWKGITCLRAAVAYNNVPVAQLLLERNDCTSPDLLLIAAHYGYEDMVRLLLQHGLSPDEMVSKDDVQWLGYFTPEPPMPKNGGSILDNILEVRSKRWNASKANCLLILIEGGARFLGGEIARLAEIGFREPLQAALARGMDPNDEDVYGRTAIQCALYPNRYLRISRSRHSNTGCEVDKRYRIIKLLLEAGAKQVGEVVNAIRERDYHLTRLLLEHGGTLKDTNERGASCLEALIMNSNHIRFMGADGHYFHDHYPFCDSATMRDDHRVQDNTSIACSTCAASWFDSGPDERDFLQAVLEKQDDPIDAGPICAAIQVKDWDLLDRLILRPHKETNCHLLEGTAIGLAARAGQMEVLEKLLSRFHHPSAIQSGFIPFYIMYGQLVLTPKDSKLRTFNDHPWVYDKNDFWRKDQVFGLRGVASPLALAALGADPSGFEALLAYGCCADKTTLTVIAQKESASVYLGLLRKHSQQLDTLSPSQSALCSILLGPIGDGNIELLKRLVDAGSDVNDYNATMDSSLSPLQLSARLGDLDNGALINARGSRKGGRTALEGAAEHGRLDMLELLLQRGAAWSNYGRQQFISAVRLASKNAHYAIVDWLKNRYGWTQEDEDFLKNGMDHWLYWDSRCKNCRYVCCDEIHGIEDDCIHYYPADLEEEWAAECYHCKLEDIEDDESQSGGEEVLYQGPGQELDDYDIFFEPWPTVSFRGAKFFGSHSSSLEDTRGPSEA